MSNDNKYHSWAFLVESEITTILYALKKKTSTKRPDHIHYREFLELQQWIFTSLYKDNIFTDSKILSPWINLLHPNELTLTSHLANAVLASIQRLLTNGLFPHPCTPTQESIQTFNDLIKAITECRFESSDSHIDEITLLRILNISTLLLHRTTWSYHLSDTLVYQVLQTCLSICFQTRLSETIRQFAEESLHSIIPVITNRYNNVSLTDDAFGRISMIEMTKAFISLVPPYDKHKSDRMRISGINLLFTLIGSLPNIQDSTLHDLIYNELTKYLFQLLDVEHSITLLQSTCKLLTYILSRFHSNMKEHIEMFIYTMIDKISSIIELSSAQDSAVTTKYSMERRQLYITCLLQILSIPFIFPSLFVHCDSNIHSRDVIDDLVKFIVKGIIQFNDLFLALLIHFLSDIKERQSIVLSDRYILSLDQLSSNRTRKRIIFEGSTRFNSNAKDGIHFLIQNEEISTINNQIDNDSLSKFLMTTPTLSKKSIGEYLSKSDNASLLKAYMKNFSFENKSIDQALRIMLESFRLPGESILIERIMEAFAACYYNQSSNNTEIASKSAAFVLAYSITMLNTDQHNPNVKNRMTLETFIRNNRGINDGKDFSVEFLSSIYENIKANEIILPDEHDGELGFQYKWNEMIKRNSLIDNWIVQSNSYDFEIYSLVKESLKTSLIHLLEICKNEHEMEHIMQAYWMLGWIICQFNDTKMMDGLLSSIYNLTGLQKKHEYDIKKLLENKKLNMTLELFFQLVRRCGNSIRRIGWKHLIECICIFYNLVPIELTQIEDFIRAGKQSIPRKLKDSGSGLFSFFWSNTEENDNNLDLGRDHQMSNLMEMIDEWRFLSKDALVSLLEAIIEQCEEYISIDRDSCSQWITFLIELLYEIIHRNRDRLKDIWPVTYSFLKDILTNTRICSFIHERAIVFLIKLCSRILHQEDMQNELFTCFELIKNLPLEIFQNIAEQFMAGLMWIGKLDPNGLISSPTRWDILFLIISITSKHPKAYVYSFQLVTTLVEQGQFQDDMWMECADLLFGFISATISGDENSLPLEYGSKALQLIYLMFCRLVDDKRQDVLWNKVILPLLHGLSLQYMQISLLEMKQACLVTLQRCLFVEGLFSFHVERQLKDVYEMILFPLLHNDMDTAHGIHKITSRNTKGNILTEKMEELRIRMIHMSGKLFLKFSHIIPDYPALMMSIWVQYLDCMINWIEKKPVLHIQEAIRESLKNMILVLVSGNILLDPNTLSESKWTDSNVFWNETWTRVNQLCPSLKEELLPSDVTEAIDTLMEEDIKQSV